MTGFSAIDDALRRHRLADVARRTGIPLSSDAGSVTVRCPLPSHGHPDRTPSMRLYLDDSRYYCFGCSAKGDVIQWVRETEGVGVAAAIRVLGSNASLTNAWAGVTSGAGARRSTPQVSGASGPSLMTGRPEAPDLYRTPRERVLAALAAAWVYYTRPPLHAPASAYLARRSIDVAVLEAHTGRPETGHTPAKADGLVAALRDDGFSLDELVDAGLAHRYAGSEQASDFYRQRILIPIRDDRQRVVGIIGRNIGDQQRWTKYNNPPRTAIYDKSANLYQPLVAPADPRGAVIVVEGTLDAMAIAVAAIRTGQADRYCPVTQSGRELSDAQQEQILSMHPGELVLAFDGDTAGRDAANRYVVEVTGRGRRVAVTILPDDHDPASWLADRGDVGLHAWERCAMGRSPQAAAGAVSKYLVQPKYLSLGRRHASIAFHPWSVARAAWRPCSDLSAGSAAVVNDGIPL